MTDETNGTTPAFAFEAVAVADLPKQDRGASPEAIAMGKALLAVLTDDTGARDPLANAERKQAINRAQVIKRAVKSAGGVPAGRRLATQIVAADDGFHVVAKLEKATGKTK